MGREGRRVDRGYLVVWDGWLMGDGRWEQVMSYLPDLLPFMAGCILLL